ncbi:amidohydrolase [Ornatilinea apprima]|uniref:5-methylthioadenosine/S-adenosylhomocysteine deaminase n=1 Tax=Ornatilinea apprima TaxID=1134406 RepID=A0A0P6WZG0_9CHLR|nr:amidohydrolase [Ornatilinea apprima]KPL72177.1 amidohydrolase [Ornatilinea apprima]
MKKVDTLLTNAIVLTMDNDLSLYEPGAVAIQGDQIVAVGLNEEILSTYSADETIDCKRDIVMPGLINAHTHVPMTLLRGLADDLRLDVWLLGYMMPVEREFVNPGFVQLGTKLACAEMIRSGVTTFVDMYYYEDDVASAAAEVGMRGICAQTVLKFPTPDSASYEEALSMTREFIQRWKGHPLIVPSVAPHAPYTCTEDLMRACAAMAIEFDVPLHTHISETAGEVENMRKEQGMPVVPYLKKLNLFDAKVIAAHCVHIDEGEMRTLQHYNIGVAHNPSSNLKLASGIAPVQKMLETGLNVGIGTDGPASNNDLDMFEEIRLANFIAKGSSGDPTVLPATTSLLMATRMGAQAIHLDHLIGSLQPGKRADIIRINLSPLHNSPRFRRDPLGAYAQVVYAAKATDVSDVMINGKWVMRDHDLLTLNEKELLAQSEELAHRIDAFLIEREKSILAKLIAVGGATEEQSFEIQAKVPVKDLQPFLEALKKPEIEIVYQRHYREYDTYFSFDSPDEGRIRYREDHFVGPRGEITNVRSRLTHIGLASERQFPEKIILSRSRFLAPATQSLRFYREYFKPIEEFDIEKDRLRFLIRFKDTELYINLDTVNRPKLGKFLEVKSRTWSRKDAERKALIVSELISYLGASLQESEMQDYFQMIQ